MTEEVDYEKLFNELQDVAAENLSKKKVTMEKLLSSIAAFLISVLKNTSEFSGVDMELLRLRLISEIITTKHKDE